MKVLLLTFLFQTLCFADAHSLFDQGKYDQALQELQNKGLVLASDYYNAGNSLFRLGKLGQALAYYEKGLTLAPGNDDILYNLALTKEALDKTGALPKDSSLWRSWLVPTSHKLSKEWIELIFACISMIFAYTIYKSKSFLSKNIFKPSLLFVFMLWITLAFFSTTIIIARHVKLAVIISEISIARSGPRETFTELFKLPAGTKVEWTSQGENEWRKIRFSLGNVGWVMEKDLLRL